MGERTGYLTEDEVMKAALTLPTDTPFAILYVSQTVFSLARHYGGMTYQGKRYTYFPQHDELVRDDVLKMVTKDRKESEKARRLAGPVEEQTELFGGTND